MSPPRSTREGKGRDSADGETRKMWRLGGTVPVEGDGEVHGTLGPVDVGIGERVCAAVEPDFYCRSGSVAEAHRTRCHLHPGDTVVYRICD